VTNKSPLNRKPYASNTAMLRWLILLPLLVACGSRDPARIGSDADGAPVTVTVHYDPEALSALTQNAGFLRTVVVDRGPWIDPWLYAPGYRYPYYHPHMAGYYGMGYYGMGYGSGYAYEPSTMLHLLLGRGPAEGQYLRLTLGAHLWTGTLSIAPGSTVVVSLQGSGGRSGWREIGRFVASANLSIRIRCEGAEPRIETQTPAP